jgi:hypothetical protein
MNEVDEICGMHGKGKKNVESLVGKLEGKRPQGRT